LGLISLHEGEPIKAREFLAMLEPSTETPGARRPLLTSEYLGDTYLEEGDAKAALERYDAVWPLAMALVPKGDIIAELRRRKAEAFLLLGRFEDSHREAKGALEHCRELGDRYEEAAVYRTLALSAAALGKPDEARQWFQQGFAYYDDIETPYEWGKLWMAYGDWLNGPNAGEFADKAGAIEAYQAAREHFEHMGAMGKLAAVQARLQEVAPLIKLVPEPVAQTALEPQRPRRRPRGSSELDRRSGWAKETFGFISRSKVVLDLLRDVAKLARSQSPVLILGESGTGKELVAAGMHRLSNRPGSYMPVNCGALPRDVIESELFGHMSGAFTGATRDKMGLFESCNAGTVFLDEIGEMSLELQSKLLRFLETGEFRRVGSTKNVAVDVLVIAATNREREALESGRGFRADLYYRLAHAVVTIPPLRRRGEDIDVLVTHFLEDACARHGKQVVLSTAARNRLIAYSWPGNVRQLRSAVNRLVVLSEPGHEIPAEVLELPVAEAPANLMEELEQAEQRRIVEALALAAGVRTEAAKTLGMSRTTLIGKMKRYGIQ
jgi:DNA-binding NtrC family response regulator